MNEIKKAAGINGGPNQTRDRHPSYTATIDDATAIALHQMRQRAELAVVKHLAASCRWLGSVAREAGITPDDFGDDDTRILAAALLDPGEHALARRLWAVKTFLEKNHLYSADEPAFSTSMIWSAPKLARLGVSIIHPDRDTAMTCFAALRLIRQRIASLAGREVSP